MTNNLPARRNAQVALRKAKNLIEVTDRILAGRDTRLAATDEETVSREMVNDRWVKNVYANGDVTMIDKETGRMWLYDASLCGEMGWDAAVAYCNKLTYAGYSDWRLPSIDELKVHFSQKVFFAGVQNDYYWSGTSLANDTDYAYFVNMYFGYVNDVSYKPYNDAFVWPVRGGQ
jgi:hypothetical protein